MLTQFYQKIWTEAYGQNDNNILSFLDANPLAKVIDIGCGDGQKSIKFKDKIGCKEIWGLDGVTERLKVAKKRGVDHTIKSNLETSWPIENSTFDVVISNQVIEHISDIDLFIGEIKRILKPGGYAVISTENLSSWHNIFALILGYQDFSHTIIKKKHISNPMSLHYNKKTATWSKKGNSGVDDSAYPHIKILTYYSLIKSFETYNFRFVKGTGAGYYPLWSWLSNGMSKIDPYHSHFITIKTTNL
ncbi:MAG: type 11 methyltransferase [uncultured bacterium]|nr:MAG: type 11 methyltransferase [uncultured bacterium]